MLNDPNLDWIDAADKQRSERLAAPRLTGELWWQHWLKAAFDAVGCWPDMRTYGYTSNCPLNQIQRYRSGAFIARGYSLNFRGLELEGPCHSGPDFVLWRNGKPTAIIEAKLNNKLRLTQIIGQEGVYNLKATLLLSYGNPNEGDLIKLLGEPGRTIILFEEFLKHVDLSPDGRYIAVKKQLSVVLRELKHDLEGLAARTNADVSPWASTADMLRFDTYYRCLENL